MLFAGETGARRRLRPRFAAGLQAAVRGTGAGREVGLRVLHTVRLGAPRCQASLGRSGHPINHHGICSRATAEIQRPLAMAGGSLPPRCAEAFTPLRPAPCRWGPRVAQGIAGWTPPSPAKRAWVLPPSTTSRCRPTRCCLPGGAVIVSFGGLLRLAAQTGKGRFRPPPGACAATGGLPQPLGGASIRSAVRSPAVGREGAPATSVASAPSRAMSRQPQFPFHRKHPPATGSGAWPVRGILRGPARPWPRGHRRMSPSTTKRAAPRPACSRFPGPRGGGHGGVWFTTAHPVRPAWKRRAHDLGCWALPRKTGPETGPKQAPQDRLGWRAGSYLERIHGRVTGRPPAPIWPECRPCRPLLREGSAGPAGLPPTT